MYRNKKILALITARGKSKRLPDKNIKPFCGKPLIAWTIKQAKQSRYIDAIIVSTEDPAIAKISKKYGAGVPFLRPRRLATDKAKSIDVILHVLKWFEDHGKSCDVVVLLQPTSPLRTSYDIDKAIELIFLKRANAVVSVSKSEHSPHWINTLYRDGWMRNFAFSDSIRKAGNYHILNGAVYLAYSTYLKKYKSFLGAKTFAYVMPPERSVDIDTALDFKFAQMLKNNSNKND